MNRKCRNKSLRIKGCGLLNVKWSSIAWAIMDQNEEMAEGIEKVYLMALGNLAGRELTDAIRIANKYADRHEYPHVHVVDFRKWLPEFLSKLS